MRQSPCVDLDNVDDDACNAMSFRLWVLGGAQVAQHLCTQQQRCALSCCCANLSTWWPSLLLSRHDACSSRLAAAKRASHQHCVPVRGVTPLLPPLPPPHIAPKPSAWTDFAIVHPLGRGNAGMHVRVRFPTSGFECAMKTYRPRAYDRAHAHDISIREVAMQSRASDFGVAPRIYHHSPSADLRGERSVLFSELMVRDAWGVDTFAANRSNDGDDDNGPRGHGSHSRACAGEAVRTCDEISEAMSRLDAAGVAHGDLKLEHFMRSPSGALRIVDYTAASRVAPDAADCATTNVESFVQQNACFHSARTRAGAGVDHSGGPHVDHRLVDLIEHSPARTVGVLAASYECFATVCFPRLVRAAWRAQRRRARVCVQQ